MTGSVTLRRPLMLYLALAGSANLHAQVVSDPAFDTTVERPAYVQEHPRVVIDEAHFNYHTASDRYRPLALLLRSDGYEVSAGTAKFDRDSLRAAKVLIIANARGGAEGSASVGAPAFTEAECDAVRDWVRAGGALLLIADHAPFGSAAANLAGRFGVVMGKGHVFDLANSDANPTILVFSNENGLLGRHAITRGRGDAENVKRVVAFEGQSLSVPQGATTLMKLGSTAYESDSREDMQLAQSAAQRNPTSRAPIVHARSVADAAQGLAMEFGRGRLVITGEAAMFSAQVIHQESRPDFKFGMNAPGNDDRQFALNALRWLSRAAGY
jgi:hypothetical protein